MKPTLTRSEHARVAQVHREMTESGLTIERMTVRLLDPVVVPVPEASPPATVPRDPHDQIRRLLGLIHPPGATGWCELRALPSRVCHFLPLRDVDGVAQFCRAHAHENVYVGVSTRREIGRGDKAGCRELWVAFADLDFKDIAEPTARQRLRDSPLAPSLIIESGGGLHCYWTLAAPFVLPADEAAAERRLKRLARHFGSDLSVAETARILRIPGTFNHKIPPPRPVRIAEPSTWII